MFEFESKIIYQAVYIALAILSYTNSEHLIRLNSYPIFFPWGHKFFSQGDIFFTHKD